MITTYDLIGDLHGRAEKLINLLIKLGYRPVNGVYQQAGHQAIFVGDFIDRGSQERQVLAIVRRMMDNGHARAVMGNHEFNAICYHTLGKNGDYLRRHSPSHTQQHQAFLDEYPFNSAEANEMIAWFKTLPVFLELPQFRVIHACWDAETLAQLQPHLDENNCLKSMHYQLASEPGTFFYHAIETLLKGPELFLPDGHWFSDKDGTPRPKVRVKWWQKDGSTYQDAAVVSEQNRGQLPAVAIPPHERLVCYPDSAPPVFFGHYWFTGQPQIISANSVCLDYSAARAGQLVAYRFEVGQPLLCNENFYASDENL
jgi:hypothetical protein